MFAPTVRHRCWKVGVEPVKWMPARSGCGQRHLGDVEAVAGQHVDHARRQAGLLEQLHGQVRGELLGRRRLPDDGVAHQRRRGRQVAGDRGEVERRDRVDEALQRAVVGAVPDAAGCWRSAARRGSAGRSATLNRQKSISSQAASISAWYAVLDWPSMVAALSVCRHGPASRSAALSRIAARSSKRQRPPGRRGRPGAPRSAARASAWVAFCRTPRTCWWSCGCTTWGSPSAPRRALELLSGRRARRPGGPHARWLPGASQVGLPLDEVRRLHEFVSASTIEGGPDSWAPASPASRQLHRRTSATGPPGMRTAEASGVVDVGVRCTWLTAPWLTIGPATRADGSGPLARVTRPTLPPRVAPTPRPRSGAGGRRVVGHVDPVHGLRALPPARRARPTVAAESTSSRGTHDALAEHVDVGRVPVRVRPKYTAPRRTT